MSWSTELTALRNVLVELYPERDRSVRIVADAGFTDRNIDFDDAAIQNWHAILTEADRRNKVEALIDVVRADYGEHQPFNTAAQAYLRSRSRDSDGTTTVTPQEAAIPPNPYRGLDPFREEDEQVFFGRATFISDLKKAVDRRPLVAMIGPSGSGKSSVLCAGILPRLRRSGGWVIASFLPGAHPGTDPFDGLSATLVQLESPEMSETDRLHEGGKLAASLRSGAVKLVAVLDRIRDKRGSVRLLLIADQFEQIYTRSADPAQQQAFLDVLLAPFSLAAPVSGQPASFVLLPALRADFMSEALAYPPLVAALQGTDLKLGSMNSEELRQAIEEPAKLRGVGLEKGLADVILDDVGDEPGNLPLLEFALSQLWLKQQNGLLTHDGYKAIGRVERALADHAEVLYHSLSESDREHARQIFIQLVRPGESTGDTRRRAKRSELREGAWELVERLATAKLVITEQNEITGEDVVGVHEALVSGWDRFQEWVDTDRGFRSWQERLRDRVGEWAKNHEDEGALLGGRTLLEAESWLEERGNELSRAERELIQASVAARDREALEREAKLRLAAELADARRLEGERRRQAILAETGWGVVFADGADPAIREALVELLDHRRQQATQIDERLYREFIGTSAYKYPESGWAFLSRQRVGDSSSSSMTMPFYLLLVGDPESIPYSVEYHLKVQHAVGRIHFETAEEYSSYARSVVAAETGKGDLPRSAHFVGVSHPDDVVTNRFSANWVAWAADLARSDQPNWTLLSVLGADATKQRLQRLLGGDETPALLFLAGHGMTFPRDDARQVSRQGAVVCADWPGPKKHVGELPSEFYLSGEDITDNSRLLGLIAFLFSSHSAGTPRESDFSLDPSPYDESPDRIAQRAFVARLPQRLLGHPKGGALAVISHVERVWSSMIDRADKAKPADLNQSMTELLDPIDLYSTLKRLMENYPVGTALDPIKNRYLASLSMMIELNPEHERNDSTHGPDMRSRKIAVRDARNWVIVGDPAVRLPCTDEARPTPRPVIEPITKTLRPLHVSAAPTQIEKLEPEVTELLFINGINVVTGEYLVPPMTIHDVARLAQGGTLDDRRHLSELKWRQRNTAEATF